MKILFVTLIVTGLLLASGAARAEPALLDESPYGISFGVGGGVTAFYDTDMTQLVDSGAAWDARLVVRTRSRMAIEAAYVGSLQDIDAVEMGDASLFGTGVEAAARLNIVPGIATPYLLAGVGWTHYEVLDAQDAAVMASGDDVVTLPVGLGLDYRIGQYIVDGRGVLRPTFDNDLVPTRGAATRLDSWALILRGAMEF